MSLFVLAIAAGCSFSPTLVDADAHQADAHGAVPPDGGAPDAPPDAPKVCPPTYTVKSPTASYRFTVNLTWPAAEADCMGDGNHLVHVDDAAEDAFLLANLTGANFFWIGLYD